MAAPSHPAVEGTVGVVQDVDAALPRPAALAFLAGALGCTLGVVWFAVRELKFGYPDPETILITRDLHNNGNLCEVP